MIMACSSHTGQQETLLDAFAISACVLLQVGMQQQFFLGGVLRNRYVNTYDLIFSNYTRVQVRIHTYMYMVIHIYTILMHVFNCEQVYIRSTDYDRTLMSAEAQLAALFPPEGDQVTM